MTPTTRDGTFSITISSEELAKGLRPTKSAPRDSRLLSKGVGAVGLDNVLQTLDDLNLNRMDMTGVTTLTFPYPQLFLFTCAVILCTKENVYELSGSAWTNKFALSAGQQGIPWSALDFFGFAYMSNGKISLTRDPGTLAWSLSTLPIFSGACNFNGQIMLGAPDTEWV